MLCVTECLCLSHNLQTTTQGDGCKGKSEETGEKYLSLLLAGKKTITTNDTSPLYENLVLARDRGGLWVMENFVVALFEDGGRVILPIERSQSV